VHEPAHNVLDRYEVGTMLGQGGFGIVSYAQNKRCGRECVLKVVNRDVMPNTTKLDSEVEMHASLDHPHIVRIYETFAEASQLCIVMELCNGGELFSAVDKKEGVCSEREARHVFRQIMGAVCYLHGQRVAHRDVKLENFLIKESGVFLSQCTIKLIDFGLAARFEVGSASLMSICGTPDYMAPEVFVGAPYDEKCDVWSCGVVLYTMLSGYMPYGGDSINELIQNLKRRPLCFHQDYWKSISQDAQNLITGTCCKVVANRLSARQTLAESWLKAHETSPLELVDGAAIVQMGANPGGFGELPAWHRALLYHIVCHIEDEYMYGLPKAPLWLDANCNAQLTEAEVYGVPMQSDLIAEFLAKWEQLLDRVDSDGSGSLEYTEFLAATLGVQGQMSLEACTAAFGSFDLDGVGAISMSELRQSLAQILAQDRARFVDAESPPNFPERHEIDKGGVARFRRFVEMLTGSFAQPTAMHVPANHGGA